MDIMTLIGFSLAAAVMAWGIITSGVGALFLNAHGIVLVIGGTLAATIVNTSFSGFMSGVRAFAVIFRSPDYPSIEDCVKVLVQLSDTAHKQGGIMALQNVDPGFARGFLRRAVSVAMVSGESRETRAMLEEEVRRRRLAVNEDSNFYRTMAVLSPMFGLIGTLFGIIETLTNISDPTAIGRSMAVAISSAFYGIALSNFFFVPVANKIRLRAIEETAGLQLIIEGVMDIMAGKTPHLVEMHLRGYLTVNQARLARSEA